MQVICLEEVAFYELIEKVVSRLKDQQNTKEDQWISGEEAMTKLRIKSTTTLQNLRDTGAIRFSQPTRKLILYDVESIYEYLKNHSRETF